MTWCRCISYLANWYRILHWKPPSGCRRWRRCKRSNIQTACLPRARWRCFGPLKRMMNGRHEFLFKLQCISSAFHRHGHQWIRQVKTIMGKSQFPTNRPEQWRIETNEHEWTLRWIQQCVTHLLRIFGNILAPYGWPLPSLRQNQDLSSCISVRSQPHIRPKDINCKTDEAQLYWIFRCYEAPL